MERHLAPEPHPDPSGAPAAGRPGANGGDRPGIRAPTAGGHAGDADRPDGDRPDGAWRPGVDGPRTPPRLQPPAWTGTAAVGLLLLALALAALVAGLGASDRVDEDDLRAPDAVLLGLVEGVTEWLPISSTGHLTVSQDLLGIDGDAADSYAIAIQAGAILAVLGLYRGRFASMVAGARGRDPVGRNTLIAVILACLPAVAVGLLLEDVIKDKLFGAWPVAVAWLVGGVAILAFARSRRRRGLAPDSGAPLSALDWQGALFIGCVQVLAMWPGVSRSLVTILAATALGLAVPAAVEFSFLLGFVTLGGATAYETLSSGQDMIDAYGLAVPLLGLAVAFVSAIVAMRWMVGYLERHGLELFGWYRIGAASVLAVLLLSGAV